MCHADFVALVLQDQPLLVIQQFLNGVEDRVCQLKTLDLGLGGS